MNAHAAPIAPDEATIRKFFEILHEHAAIALSEVADPGVLQLSRVWPDERSRLTVVGRFPIGTVDAMTEAAMIEASTGHNVYVEGRTVRTGLLGNERGTFEDTRGVFALVSDADADKGKDAELGDVEPSMSVETSPGNWHHWFFLERAIAVGDARAIGADMRLAIGGDADTGNPTQPYRVAGTPNFPAPGKLGRGRVPTPTGNIVEGRSWNFEELRTTFAQARRAPLPASDASPVRDRLDRDAEELLASVSAKRRDDLAATDAPDRSAHFHKVTGWLKGDGFTEAEALALWEAFPTGAGVSKYGLRLEREIGRVWAKAQDEPYDAAEATAFAERLRTSAGLASVPRTASRGTLIDFGEDRPYVHEPELIRDTLPRTGFAFVGGQSGAGKSFLVNKLASCFTTGEPFAGRKIERTGGVLILASEGQGTLAGRMKATRLQLPDPTVRLPIAAIGDFGSIAATADYVALHFRLRDVVRWMEEEHGVPLVAFFLDTVSAFNMIAEDKENDPASWNLLMGNLKAISADVGALAIGVHHYGKNASAGLRGSSGAWANADAVLSVTGERDLKTGEVFDRAIALAKNRNGPEGPIGAVELRPVAIGHREDGTEVRSLVFEIDTGVRTVNARTMKRPSKAQSAFMDAFRSALSDHSRDERVHGTADGARIKAVDVVQVRREFALRYVVAQDDDRKRADTLRKQFENGLKKAEEAGVVCSGAWAGAEWIWSLEIDVAALKASQKAKDERRKGTE
ncbi:ATP-binding protein [Aureimonas leprariae]|uniref:AAA family ATPase n=1 Tax=Plantimonas leprariae TaxID=2615207 RepID=A0A7V7TUH1_9HYPH|nr:AAA family ATPase [Aureimonas leprariae]KAB0676005.1 AAA family ATPase [Aureimonas leprariae]